MTNTALTEDQLIEKYGGSLLYNVDDWYLSDENTIGACVIESRNTRLWHKVAEADLMFYGEQLPIIVRGLLAHNKKSGLDFVNGNLVRASNNLFKRGSVNIIHKNVKYYFLNVTDVVVSWEPTSSLTVKGMVIEEHVLCPAHEYLWLVTSLNFLELTIGRDVLDQSYDGWEQRYNVGVTMKMKPWELCQYVFVKKELSASFLDMDISFA